MDLFISKRVGLALVISLVAVACAAPTIPNDSSGDEEEESCEAAATGK